MNRKKIEKIKQEKEYKKPLIKRRKPNRSVAGDITLYVFLILMAYIMAIPIIFTVSNSLKPLDELFRFPPRFYALHPTTDNFADLIVNMGKSTVTFSRYIFTTVLITAAGTAGHLIVASMAAFVLSKYDFPGGKAFFKLATVALMFTGYATSIPNYIILNKLAGSTPIGLS